MAEDSPDHVAPDHVTIVRESGSGSTMLIAIVILLLVAVIGFWVMNSQTRVDPTDASVAAAADKVGAAAEKVGDAAQDAVK